MKSELIQFISENTEEVVIIESTIGTSGENCPVSDATIIQEAQTPALQIQCIQSVDDDRGCGAWSQCKHSLTGTSCTSDFCECGNLLLSSARNAAGHRLYLGQIVFFFRNGPIAILERGIVVHLPNSSDGDEDSKNYAIVKYCDSAYSHDRYDEIVHISKVFLQPEDADSGKGRRNRVTASKEPKGKVTKVKRKTAPSATLITTSARYDDRPATPEMVLPLVKKNKRPRAAVPLEAISHSPASAKRACEAVSGTTLATGAGTLIRPTSQPSREGMREQVVTRRLSDDSQSRAHELADRLYPSDSCGESEISEVRVVDVHVKRGMLHAVYHFMDPPEVGTRDTCKQDLGPAFRVAQLFELLECFPTCEAEMADTLNMPLCCPLLYSPPAVTGPASVFPSLGLALISVVKSYLAERGFNDDAVAMLKVMSSRDTTGVSAGTGHRGSDGHTSNGHTTAPPALPRGLSIPLSFDHFSVALDLAFSMLHGREAFENRKGVKGLEYVRGSSDDSCSSSSSSSSSSSNSRNGTPRGKGKSKSSTTSAMYGAMNPLFIEEAVVQTSRMGHSSDFLDIGSGIGQVVIQVACTVGCRSIGMEICEPRHEAALELLAAVESVLNQAGLIVDESHPSLSSLVDLRQQDFTKGAGDAIVKAAQVTFFNNFGPWFDPLMETYNIQCVCKAAGSQVIVLNPLIDMGCWSHLDTFTSGKMACTWSDLDNPVYRYTVPSGEKEWECGRCTLKNIVGNDECQGCYAKRLHKRLGIKASLR